MKKLVAVTLSVAAGLSGLALAQTAVRGAEPALQGGDRVGALEQELASVKERSRKLETDLLDVKNELALVKQHLQAQAQAAAAMQATLDASEEAGFTYGINPGSRELLLAGWREQLATAQKPLVAPPAEDTANGRRRR